MFNSSVPYTEIFELLSQFQKSKSENRELPLDIDKRLLSWFHAYDYHDYARHFSYYWAKQQELPVTHPSLYEEVVDSNFSITRTTGTFNRISPGQATEQTVNKDKEPGN